MHRLFALSYRRILSRLGQEDLKPTEVQAVLENNKIMTYGQGFLYRLPREELKHILNIPCPINSLEGQANEMIVSSAKVLRHHGRIKEEKVCFKCAFKDSCPVAKQSFTGTVEDTPKHLLVYWSALDNFRLQDSIYFRQWTSAYKLGDSIIAALNDLAQAGSEIEEYNKLRLEAALLYEQKQKKEPKEGDEFQSMGEDIQMRKKYEGKLSKQELEDFTKPELEVLGKDQELSEGESIEPESSFTRQSYTGEERRPKPLKKQKGYQAIENNEDEQERQPYSKYQPREQKKYQQTSQYDRREGGYAREQREPRYEQRDQRESRYEQRDQRESRQYNQEPRQYNKDDGRKSFNRKSDNQDESTYRPKQYHNEKPRSYDKPERNSNSSFVSKWKPEAQTYYERSEPKQNKDYSGQRERREERGEESHYYAKESTYKAKPDQFRNTKPDYNKFNKEDRFRDSRTEQYGNKGEYRSNKQGDYGNKKEYSNNRQGESKYGKPDQYRNNQQGEYRNNRKEEYGAQKKEQYGGYKQEFKQEYRQNKPDQYKQNRPEQESPSQVRESKPYQPSKSSPRIIEVEQISPSEVTSGRSGRLGRGARSRYRGPSEQ